MEKLISELLDPARAGPQGRLRPQPLQGRHRAREDARPVRRHAATRWRASTTPSGFIQSAVEATNSKACYLHGSFGAGKSHFMAVLHLLLAAQPRRAGQGRPGEGLRQARLGRGQEVPARAVPHDRLPQHGVGHPGRLRRSRHGASPRRPAAGRLPGRRDLQERRAAPPAAGRREVLRGTEPGQPGRRAARAGASSPRAGTPPGSRPPWRPRPPARTGPAWSATWCSTSSRPSRGSPRARTKPTSISTWA